MRACRKSTFTAALRVVCTGPTVTDRVDGCGASSADTAKGRANFILESPGWNTTWHPGTACVTRRVGHSPYRWAVVRTAWRLCSVCQNCQTDSGSSVKIRFVEVNTFCGFVERISKQLENIFICIVSFWGKILSVKIRFVEVNTFLWICGIKFRNDWIVFLFIPLQFEAQY